MATIATPAPAIERERRFFLVTAIVMTFVMVSGFSLQWLMGRSSFTASPIRVHAHALIFFGWVMLYLSQNLLVASGSTALHRRLGWLAVGWIPAMMAMGTIVTVAMVREGRVPFFFQPAYFLVMDPLSVYTFAGLAAAAIVMRRRTLWHRRLMFCAMTILLGPGFGRLLPVPLLMPYVGEAVFATIILFPIAGVIRDWRADGRVHPAWWVGIATIAAMQIAINLITFGPLGPALYHAVAAGSAGAAIDPLALGALPPGL